jgi:hypothetical protein
VPSGGKTAVLELEVPNEQVPAVVKSGKADLGLTAESDSDPDSPWLVFEPAYELEIRNSHPLWRRGTRGLTRPAYGRTTGRLQFQMPSAL